MSLVTLVIETYISSISSLLCYCGFSSNLDKQFLLFMVAVNKASLDRIFPHFYVSMYFNCLLTVFVLLH